MAEVTLGTVVAQAQTLTREERWRLVSELLQSLRGGEAKDRSIRDYFGVLGPSAENVDDRVRRLREEWE